VPYTRAEDALNVPVTQGVGSEGMPGHGGRRVPLIASDDFRVILLEMAPGDEPHRPHRHPRADEVLIVMEGRGCFTIGDEDHVAGPGSVVYAPRGVRHRIQTPGPEKLVWLSVVVPNEDAPDESVEEDDADVPDDGQVG
jgi:mannose-6-phosphate isomerase-like protein (cupin superfamily)